MSYYGSIRNKTNYLLCANYNHGDVRFSNQQNNLFNKVGLILCNFTDMLLRY